MNAKRVSYQKSQMKNSAHHTMSSTMVTSCSDPKRAKYAASQSRLVIINDNAACQKKGLENIQRKKAEEKKKKDLFRQRLCTHSV